MKNKMLLVHQNNLQSKVNSNYKGKKDIISAFYNDKYLPVQKNLFSLDFCSGNMRIFSEAARIINSYYDELTSFANKNSITSQSKFASTFLEEISIYLFNKHPLISQGEYGFYNKKIFAGLKINNENKIDIIPKDVDFCIGKKADISINHCDSLTLIVPIVSVEVKTYLDATMFGEVKSSSKAIKSASPNSKAYVLMGYKCIEDEHIISAKRDSVLNEIFCLREKEESPIDAKALYCYWEEITQAINEATNNVSVIAPGPLFKNIK